MVANAVFYSVIEIIDKSMFVDPVDIPVTISHKKEYDGDTCTLTLYKIEERLLRNIKIGIASNKAKHYGAKTASNLGTCGARFAKSLHLGGKTFMKELTKGDK